MRVTSRNNRAARAGHVGASRLQQFLESFWRTISVAFPRLIPKFKESPNVGDALPVEASGEDASIRWDVPQAIQRGAE
jgi:hypothetical protein